MNHRTFACTAALCALVAAGSSAQAQSMGQGQAAQAAARAQGEGMDQQTDRARMQAQEESRGLAQAQNQAEAQGNNQGQDDISKKIIDKPDVGAYRVDGLQGAPEIRKDKDVQGGRALRVHVPGKSAHPWDLAVGVPVVKPIKAGDQLVLAFWARLVEGENGATVAHLPYNAVQLATAPYTTLVAGPADIGPQWKLYSVAGVADHDYKAGDVGVTIQLATAKQVVDIGPVFLLDLGPKQ